MAFDAECSILYVAGGKSDVIALNVGDLNNVTACETFGSTSDNFGTWGLDLFDDKLYLAYIWAPFTPPHSNFTGFRELDFASCNSTVGLEETHSKQIATIFPNPASNLLVVNSTSPIDQISIIDVLGKRMNYNSDNHSMNITLDISMLRPGTYFIEVKTDSDHQVKKFIKNN